MTSILAWDNRYSVGPPFIDGCALSGLRSQPLTPDHFGTPLRGLFTAGRSPTLHTDLETFTRRNHVRIEFAGVVQNLLDIRVFVVRIVMVQSDALDFGFDSDIDGLLPAPMSPTDMIGQFFRCVLSVNDEAIRIFRKHQYVPIAPIDAVLHIGAV